MPSLLSKFAPADGLLAITCYRCGGRQEVGRRAQTVTCRHCNKPLQVSDVQVKKYDARREIRTVGTLIVEKKGKIVAKQVECGGMIARGEIRSSDKTIVRGVILAGPKCNLGGDVDAHAMSVSEGAELNGYYCVGKDHMVPPPPIVEEQVDDSMPVGDRVDQQASESEPKVDEAERMRALSAIATGKARVR
ncbi:MAG: polymer-forming cytoskeletal protein [Planctomycetota bacterium]